ncbi:leucyl aminopeptidase [Bacillus sonorensis]|uniref:Probable cytosol aminopeptidase n=2 Tax=Bacillus sonorensis TaxID=119858 RepID=M5P0M8_9BACI|nr:MULTISPECIES: leucyl aminopeptidase [Bacillus]ASB90611.1 Leucyl aminopeptidase [Bacillus sonorensis]EME73009.1 multifunctional aminopeptidase A [Bacillus sonorensis L12]MBG9914024.1 aminopeptidase A [Bacillus sonorensis]MCF7616749.1 leucyl aminopeptidase [Bacillus sonorensis]MCY7857326.1 leucyl aminopeptidase [Bacillus sonorensis]
MFYAFHDFEKNETLMIGLFKKSQLNGKAEEIDRQLNGQLTQLLKDGDVSSTKAKVSKIFTPSLPGVKRLYVVGLGREAEFTFEDAKHCFAEAIQMIHKDRKQELTVCLDTFVSDRVNANDAAHALAESAMLSSYEVQDYKHKSNEPERPLENVYVLTDHDLKEVQASLHVGQVYGHATNSARTLVNMPGNMLTATDLASYAAELAAKYEFECEILEKEEMEELGMGGLLAVNQGSSEPPKMIVLKYQGKETWDDVIGLVGKGITFDTGGYSLKTKDGIVGMKSDMGGAASVLGAMEAIGELRPEQNVLAVIPSTDNMISATAMKPDDVIVSLSGKTIEILNTDAEGRLALADGLTYAKHHGASMLIDVATLTGGIIVALGTETTGAMTNHEPLYEELRQAAEEAGEAIWQLPITEKDKKRVKNSQMADLNNSPGREGHAIMAGTFLGEFAEQTPWVHLDIAGTATTNKSTCFGPKGGTGVMVRTLVTFVERFAGNM